MFCTPIPRSSFLDSPLRISSRLNRRLANAQPVGESHLGQSTRLAPAHAPRSSENDPMIPPGGISRIEPNPAA